MTDQNLLDLAYAFLPKTTPKERLDWLDLYGSVSAFFNPELPGDSKRASLISNQGILSALFRKAQEESIAVKQNNLQTQFVQADTYPYRLRECVDAPTLLYLKGENGLNAPKAISVVGTRKASPYGKDITNHIIQTLALYFPDLIVVSGLAYGIDAIAHQAALQANLKTFGVLAHGLQEVYPKSHLRLANQIIEAGGSLISEHSWGVPSMKHQFLERNRIVAGLCDGCLIIESGETGGSMTTARLARDYNREVMAVPGRTFDVQSRGCNKLIKYNVSSLVESAEDIANLLGWDIPSNKPVQSKLFEDLDPEQTMILGVMAQQDSMEVGELGRLCKLGIPVLLNHLLEFELNGIVEGLPGGKYRLIRKGIL